MGHSIIHGQHFTRNTDDWPVDETETPPTEKPIWFQPWLYYTTGWHHPVLSWLIIPIHVDITPINSGENGAICTNLAAYVVPLKVPELDPFPSTPACIGRQWPPATNFRVVAWLVVEASDFLVLEHVG